jgi:hypothetical protein
MILGNPLAAAEPAAHMTAGQGREGMLAEDRK